MKILILCKKFPYPLKEGEPIAIDYLSRSLHHAGCEVSLLVLNTSKHYFDPTQMPKADNHYAAIHSVRVNNDINIKGALLSLVNGKSYILSRFNSPDFHEKLKEVLLSDQFDVVQLETIYMAHYIPTIREVSSAVVSLRTHNVEHLIWQKVAKMSTSILKKWYLKLQNKSLKSFELQKMNRCDVMVAITANDLENFRSMGFNKTGVPIPVGFNSKEYKTDFLPDTKQKSIAFIGALDWMPNQDGIVWFIEHVWPIILKKHPSMTLNIAGKNTPEWMFKRGTQQIKIHGEVADAKAFISAHPVFIAPLFSGSGIKIKILEGLALGRAVVTTSIGAEGIPAKDGQEIFIADNMEHFAASINQCFDHNIELIKIRKAGRKFIQQHFDSMYLAKKLKSVYEKQSNIKSGNEC